MCIIGHLAGYRLDYAKLAPSNCLRAACLLTSSCAFEIGREALAAGGLALTARTAQTSKSPMEWASEKERVSSAETARTCGNQSRLDENRISEISVVHFGVGLPHPWRAVQCGLPAENARNAEIRKSPVKWASDRCLPVMTTNARNAENPVLTPVFEGEERR